jgi:hypothetical protein
LGGVVCSKGKEVEVGREFCRKGDKVSLKSKKRRVKKEELERVVGAGHT